MTRKNGFFPVLATATLGLLLLTACISGTPGDLDEGYFNWSLQGPDVEEGDWPRVATGSIFRMSMEVSECLGDDALEMVSSDSSVFQVLDTGSWGDEYGWCESGVSGDIEAVGAGTATIEVRHKGSSSVLDQVSLTVTDPDRVQVKYQETELLDPVALVQGIEAELELSVVDALGKPLAFDGLEASTDVDSFLATIERGDLVLLTEVPSHEVTVDVSIGGTVGTVVVKPIEVGDVDQVSTLVRKVSKRRFWVYVAPWADEMLVVAPPYEVEVLLGKVSHITEHAGRFDVSLEDEITPGRLDVQVGSASTVVRVRDQATEDGSFEELQEEGPSTGNAGGCSVVSGERGSSLALALGCLAMVAGIRRRGTKLNR